jgi:hypothetical protein
MISAFVGSIVDAFEKVLLGGRVGLVVCLALLDLMTIDKERDRQDEKKADEYYECFFYVQALASGRRDCWRGPISCGIGEW